MDTSMHLVWMVVALVIIFLLYKLVTKKPPPEDDSDDERLDALQQQLNKQQQELDQANSRQPEVVVSTLPWGGGYWNRGAYPYFYRGRRWRR